MNDPVAIENKRLCESTERVPVRETLSAQVVAAPGAAAEALGGKRGLYTAKVSHGNRVNGNRRIYPTEVLAENVKRLQPLLEKGYLAGAVDHVDYDASGNLRDTAVIWRSLEARDDGSVWGQFEVVEGHSRGKDVKALLDAGLAVGVSTMGYGTAHLPSETERQKYGIAEGDQVVVMDGNYELKQADLVSDPSCHDARVAHSEAVESAHKQVEHEAEVAKAARLADAEAVESAQPPVVGGPDEDKQTMSEANKPAETPAQEKPVDLLPQLEAMRAQVKTHVEAVNAMLQALKSCEGVEVPQREVLPAETAEALRAKDAEIAGLRAELAAEKAKVSEKQGDLDRIAAEKADAERQSKAKAKAAELLKDKPAFAAQVNKSVEKRLSDKSFDEAAAEALVAEMVEILESVAVENPAEPRQGFKGSDARPAEEKQDNPMSAIAG